MAPPQPSFLQMSPSLMLSLQTSRFPNTQTSTGVEDVIHPSRTSTENHLPLRFQRAFPVQNTKPPDPWTVQTQRRDEAAAHELQRPLRSARDFHHARRRRSEDGRARRAHRGAAVLRETRRTPVPSQIARYICWYPLQIAWCTRLLRPSLSEMVPDTELCREAREVAKECGSVGDGISLKDLLACMRPIPRLHREVWQGCESVDEIRIPGLVNMVAMLARIWSTAIWWLRPSRVRPISGVVEDDDGHGILVFGLDAGNVGVKNRKPADSCSIAVLLLRRISHRCRYPKAPFASPPLIFSSLHTHFIFTFTKSFVSISLNDVILLLYSILSSCSCVFFSQPQRCVLYTTNKSREDSLDLPKMYVEFFQTCIPHIFVDDHQGLIDRRSAFAAPFLRERNERAHPRHQRSKGGAKGRSSCVHSQRSSGRVWRVLGMAALHGPSQREFTQSPAERFRRP